MKIMLENGHLLIPDLPMGWLLLDKGTIQALGVGKSPHTDCIHIDANGNYISPGFIDIHVHGGGGHDFMDGSEKAMEQAAKTHMRHGTTALVPTTLCCPNEELLATFDCYRSLKRNMKDGPALLGLHLEGPFFSREQIGAQDPVYLQKPTAENYLPLLDAGGNDIVRMSVAVELEGALALGDELKRRGILASIGHSNAQYSEVQQAVAHGYSHVTHLYSGMSMLRRMGAYRHLGIVESTYLMEELTAEIICDGCHLPPELLQLIVKCIPKERLVLITDAMRGADMPAGSKPLLGSLAHGQMTVIKDRVAFMPDGLSFAGSVCTTDRCVRVMTQQGKTSLLDAVKMITETPARLMKVKKGKLAVGMDADICVFDEAIQIQRVFVGGVQTYMR